MATLKSIKNKYLDTTDGDVLGVTTNTENISSLSFRLAGADSLSKFNLVDGFSDDYIDATGVDASASTNEIRDSSNYYSGSSSAAANATGGSITTSGGNTIHTFNTAGNGSATNDFVTPGGSATVTYLVIAGGGSGGSGYAGGGGAGGFRTGTFSLGSGGVTPTTYAITSGAGGVAGSYGGVGTAGADSVFSTITSAGGGRGGGPGNKPGTAGGSGGGGSDSGSGGGGNTPSTSPSQGNPGAGGPGNYGGGGGGAGGGGSGGGTGTPGPGGSGTASSITGASVTYAGGGGGGSAGPSTNGAAGGSGGGGAGGRGIPNGQPGYNTPGPSGDLGVAGTDGLGAGGGGGGYNVGGDGGNGVVIASYTTNAFTSTSYLDMTLQSNAFTAQADPTTARVIMDEWAYKGSQTLNTDIKAYASRDNGTTFSQITLADQGTLAPTGDGGIQGNTILMMHCDGANGGTTFTDVSSEGGNTAQTCTANGNAQTKTDQFKFGTASAYFDGTGDYVAVTGDAEQWAFASADFTIDFWIRPGTSGSQQRVFGDLNSGGSAAGFEFIQGGDDKMGFSGSAPVGLAMNDPTVMTMDTWYHFAVTRLGNEFRMYRDGVSVATVTIAGGMHRGLIPIGIGRSGDYNAQYFEGYIDEVRIQNGIAVWSGATSFTPPVAPYAATRRLLSGSVDVSGQPAGAAMKYKIETLNQAATKQTRIYAASMAWA